MSWLSSLRKVTWIPISRNLNLIPNRRPPLVLLQIFIGPDTYKRRRQWNVCIYIYVFASLKWPKCPLNYLKMRKTVYDKASQVMFRLDKKIINVQGCCLTYAYYNGWKKDILNSLKRPKWPIRPNKRSHLKMLSCIWEQTHKKM